MSKAIELIGASGRQRFIDINEQGDMHINWEVYGDGDGGRDMETDLIISKDEFPVILARYGFADSVPLLEALREISESGRGDQFITELFDGTIPLKEKYVY